MRFRAAGKVTERLWYLGREEAGVYYLQGAGGSIMINGGMSYLLPDILAQMEQFQLDPARISKFIMLHSHFDHVGIVPYFKRTFPHIEVLASEPAWKVFAMPKAIQVMNSYNGLSAGRVGASEVFSRFDLEWRDDISGSIVGDGDTIDLGGCKLKIIATPGHSHCSITAYEPGLAALFASDAAGIPFKDGLFPSMNTNMDQFLESLGTLRDLPVSYACADHYGYITGAEAGQFIELTIREGRKWREILEDWFSRCQGDVDKASEGVTELFYRDMPDYFIAPDILQGVFKQIFKYLAKKGAQPTG